MTSGISRPSFVLMCDDVRQEKNGKLIIIGMYIENIGALKVPIQLPTLSFVCRWEGASGESISGCYTILSPSSKTISSLDIEVSDSKMKANTHLAILQYRSITFPEIGTYRLMFKQPNRRVRNLFSFDVFMASNESE